MHRIVKQVLDDLTGHHEIEMPVRIGEAVALGVEVVDLAGELAVWERNTFAIDPSRRSVIGAPDLTIAAQPLEQRCNLHVAAELQHSAGLLRWRNESQGASQTRDVLLDIGLRRGV